MNEILIIVAFLIGYKLGRDNRIVEAGKVEKIFNKINPFKEKTKVFQDGTVKEKIMDDDILNIKGFEF